MLGAHTHGQPLPTYKQEDAAVAAAVRQREREIARESECLDGKWQHERDLFVVEFSSSFRDENRTAAHNLMNTNTNANSE